MKTQKVLLIFGTRPEAIKMAPLVHAGKQYNNIEIITCSTGQHESMLDQVAQDFDIEINYNFALMNKSKNLTQLTQLILENTQELIQKEQPDWVIVQGDTTTTFAGAFAAYYNKTKIIHIEAGLRSGDMNNPWPEEANRKLTTQIANINCVPTETAQENLLREFVNPESIYLTGNTVIDALQYTYNKIQNSPEILNKLKNKIPYFEKNKKSILVTAHRRENHSKISNICEILKSLANKYPETNIIFPVHLNPNIRETVYKELSDISNIYLLEPLGYQEIIYCMSQVDIIITDSGGLQEEAPYFGKPTLVMRKTSERMESVDAGASKLVDINQELILDEVHKLFTDSEYYQSMTSNREIYGDGTASKQILDIVNRD